MDVEIVDFGVFLSEIGDLVLWPALPWMRLITLLSLGLGRSSVMSEGVMVYTIRPASRIDESFIFDMLYESLYVPPDHERFPRSVLEAPVIAHYAAGFGTQVGDSGFVAEAGDERIGAAWVRLLQGENRGYGYVDDETPELTIAVKREWRGQGVGTALATELFKVVARISLSSDSRNPR